jgi:hypothetical protein
VNGESEIKNYTDANRILIIIIIIIYLSFSDTTKMQYKFLSESAVLGMNRSPLKKVQQSGVVSK